MTSDTSEIKVKGETEESLARYNRLDPHQVLSAIPMFPFNSVLDVGAGAGYFTIALGKHLFDGKVYAVDSDDEQLAINKAEIDKVRLTNTDVLKFKTGNKIPLDDNVVEGALVAFYLNQVKNPEKLMDEVKRCMQKGAWLVVLEWVKRETNQGPALENRIDVVDMRSMLEKEGFRFSSRHDLNSQQYMLIMRK
jgi:ubiquinone/menaquinone biosynthesis C-methylase UbiE